MSNRIVLPSLILAFIFGGFGGWIIRMHTEQGRALAAIAKTYMVEKRRIEAQADLAMVELTRYRMEIAAASINNTKNRAKNRDLGPGKRDR